MKIFVIGTRGIPNIPGGVEKHCQELYPNIVSAGHEITLFTRTPYIQDRLDEWSGIKLLHTYAPHSKSIEAIIHTFLSIIKARLLKPDVVHIHAIGPGLLVPFARLLGLKVVITNHGPDYDRQKWGTFAKCILKMGEYLSGKFANEVIVISKVIADIILKRCNRESNLIYNGVPLPNINSSTTFLEKLHITPGNYLLAVARFVPEKGLHDLIDSFSQIEGNYQLVIAGDADHETTYSKNLKRKASKDNRIILTGYITGDDLGQVYSNARLFILPSYHEGLPIALLEAMSFGLQVLVSNIPANLEVNLPQNCYYNCAETIDLKAKVTSLLKSELNADEKLQYRQKIETDYNWSNIAKQTISVYEKIINQ